MILPPASPPKIPYSCWRETTSKRCVVQEFGRLNIVVDRLVVDLEAHGRRIVIGAAGVRHGDDAGLQIRAAVETARCRSWVKVAIPQRRGR